MSGLIEVVGADAALPVSPFISRSQYERSSGLDWENMHSRRLRALTGDERLGIAWSATAVNRDKTRGCWVLGRRIQKHLLSHFGRREMASEVSYYHIWDHWTDEVTGAPLSVADPRLGEHLRRCDGWRRKDALDAMWPRAELEDAWRQQSFEREIEAGTRELWKPWRKMAEERTGFVGREGEGGRRKHFYDGCLVAGVHR